jgi:rare lipoprotein A
MKFDFSRRRSLLLLLGAPFVPVRAAGAKVYAQVGFASWYGREHHGLRTASGERFDMNALTVAHPTLPMSSYVRITNLENGRKAVLRVNDRGPYVSDRIVDVTKRGAEMLGFAAKGTARVRVEAVPPPQATPRPTPKPAQG